MNEPEHGLYDDTSKKFYNGKTGKWVKKLRPSAKGKFVGKTLGRTKGNAHLNKYNEFGRPQKYLQVPINVDIELIKLEAEQRGLNYEYCLFVLHKLLYNRVKLRQILAENPHYHNNYTPLGSCDIRRWIGKSYRDHIKLLTDLKYLSPKLTDEGNLSYWNGNSSFIGKKQTACYRINPVLFNRDLFEIKPRFKTIPLSDIKLTVKLHQRSIKTYLNDTVSLLQGALRNVRIYHDGPYLNKTFLPDIVEEVSLLINDINNGDIYVREDLDTYGERFHSSFTFSWASLRPLIYFTDSTSDLMYLDLSNSQYFFFTLLAYERTYKELIPEYFGLNEIVKTFLIDDSFKSFIVHAQNATLYNYVAATYGLTKSDLMKVFFAKSAHFKKMRSQSFPWLQSIIESLETKFGRNILSEVLQRLESRNILVRVCVPFLQRNEGANLISIHDGLLFETQYYTEMVEQLNHAFQQFSLPVPKFKTVFYKNPCG